MQNVRGEGGQKYVVPVAAPLANQIGYGVELIEQTIN